MKRTGFTISLFLIFILMAFIYSEAPAAEEEPLYSAGPWKGKVIEAGTKKPVEGAVVAAIWYREYDTRFTLFTDFHEAKEVLTDKDGYFEIPAYTETGETKDSWRKPQLPGPEGPIEFFVRGPTIKYPEFIIYKPTFNFYPGRAELMIFAVGPFMVEYQEFYTEKNNRNKPTVLRKNTKNFSEGLVYVGIRCFPLMEKLSKKVNFRYNSLFLSMDKARGKIKKLDIPLDCPKNAEPIPISIPGYKYELKDPLKKGGYMIIELSKTTSEEERLNAIPKEPASVGPDRLPLLYRFIKEEKELQKSKEQKKDKLKK